ncbi:MAG: hypothetical protein Q9M26_07010 [Mariprofundales bacterium]|nr:hypothetical protein [Mariprofundales bacterium]
MSRSAHQLLAKLAANDRSKQERKLAELKLRRRQFLDACDQIDRETSRLGSERLAAMQQGSEAAPLTMISGAIEEKQTMRIFLGQQLSQLADEETVVMHAWTAASMKEESHSKMQQKIDRQQQRAFDQRSGQQMDDLCTASRRSRADAEGVH